MYGPLNFFDVLLALERQDEEQMPAEAKQVVVAAQALESEELLSDVPEDEMVDAEAEGFEQPVSEYSVAPRCSRM